MDYKLKYPKTEFSAGLLNPNIEGKISNALLEAGLRQADNCKLDKNGNISNAAGTVFCAELNALTGQNGPFAKIAFKVSTRLNYELLFGDNILYIKKNGEYLKNQEEEIYSLFSIYSAADFYDETGKLRFDFVQSADVMYISHENYPLQILKRKGELDWSFSSLNFKSGPWGEMNNDKNKNISSDGNTNDLVTLYSDIGTNPIAEFGVISYGYYSVVKSFEYRIFFDNVEVAFMSGEKQLPYLSQNENIIHMLNSVPGIIATAPTNESIKIEDTTGARDNQEIRVNLKFWTIDNMSFERDFYATFSQGDSSVDLFTPDWVGRYIRLFQPPQAFVVTWRAGMSVETDSFIVYGNNYYKAGSTGTTGVVPPVHTEGSRSDGSIAWTYINSGYAFGVVTEYISANEIKIKVLSGYMPVSLNATSSTYLWQLDRNIGEETVYPNAVEFFKDRLVLASNNRLSFSQTGDYENFDDLEFGEQLPTCAIDFILQTQLNKIQWLKSLNDVLYVGTQANIIAVKAINPADVLGPNNVTYEIISNTGCSKIAPLLVDSTLLFVDSSERKIFTIQYNFQNNSFIPSEVTLNNDFFLKDGIVSWALAYNPDKTIFAVTGGGEVLALRLISAEFINLIKHKTDRRFKQVVSLFDNQLGKDTAGFVSLRNNTYLDEVAGANPLELALTASLVFDENQTDKVLKAAGLAHLAGENIYLLLNGRDYGPFTVDSEGEIDLSGLNLKADPEDYKAYGGLFNRNIIEFMPVTGAGQSVKMAVAASQKIAAVTARVYNTVYFKFGYNQLELWPVSKFDGKTAFNGDVVLDLGGNNTYPELKENGPVNSTGARFFIVQDRPLDFTICGLIYDIKIAEN